jgi:hypothetical protein
MFRVNLSPTGLMRVLIYLNVDLIILWWKLMMEDSDCSVNWQYQSAPYLPTEEELDELVGFVYLITQKDNGMKYVGKKLFHRTKTLPVTKTRKRRKKVKVESDWRAYCGSSASVQKVVDEQGIKAYHREILHLCKSKGDASYLEAKEQFDRDVLLRDDYYNGIINCRINAKHLKLKEK